MEELILKVLSDWPKIEKELNKKATSKKPIVNTVFIWKDIYKPFGQIRIDALWSVKEMKFVKLKCPYKRKWNTEFQDYTYKNVVFEL